MNKKQTHATGDQGQLLALSVLKFSLRRYEKHFPFSELLKTAKNHIFDRFTMTSTERDVSHVATAAHKETVTKDEENESDFYRKASCTEFQKTESFLPMDFVV